MELKIKGADFSAISIGKIIVLPDQISQEVRTLIGYYVNSNISADSTKAKALEWLYQQLGGNEQNSLWSRMKYLFIPAMANDVRDCYYDLKGNGSLYQGTPNWCNSTNVELNKYGAKPKEAFDRGQASMYKDNINPTTLINETVFGYTHRQSENPRFAPININGVTSGNGISIFINAGKYLKIGYINSLGNNVSYTSQDKFNQSNGLLAVMYGESGEKFHYFVNGEYYEGETISEITIPANYKPSAFTGNAGYGVQYPQKETAICGKMDCITEAEAIYLNNCFNTFMEVLVNQ